MSRRIGTPALAPTIRISRSRMLPLEKDGCVIVFKEKRSGNQARWQGPATTRIKGADEGRQPGGDPT